MFGNPYPLLMDVADIAKEDKNKASGLLTDYIEKQWQNGHSKLGWKNSHKQGGYIGLWSYEAGAVAKILGLDDSNLADCNHYPYDLVHYREDTSLDAVEVGVAIDDGEKTIAVNECSISNSPELDLIIPKEETINMDISKYLSGNDVSEIRVGQSGANVYEINGDKILKHVQRNMLKNDLFDSYIKEALFYKNKMTEPPRYLPEVLNVELSDDEIIILMKKYKQLERSNVDEKIEKIIEVLALVHNDTIPDFLRKIDNENKLLSTDRIDYCLNGWKSVLNEHGNSFDVECLTVIAEKINTIIQWHNDEERILIHGDFHWDNLLEKDDQRLCVCDWQNVSRGGASEDLSFFISRLGADGIEINAETILNIYANAVYDISGKRIDSEVIKKHMAAANVVTTFEFWHEFLHGSTEDRVKGIFDKLLNDYQLIDVT